MRAFVLALLTACAATDLETEAADTSALSANPPSPSIPPAWIDLARTKALVAVAGTNNARDVREALARGDGTPAQPFHSWQAIDAAATLLDLAGTSPRIVHAFGYGSAPDPTAHYSYRPVTGRAVELVFLGHESVAPGESPGPLSFGTGQAEDDARKLATVLGERSDVLLVGHSWGGAVIDYGRLMGIVDAPGITLGSPRKLYSNPFQYTRLRPDGDLPGELWIVRRPDDPIASENVLDALHALIDSSQLAAHDYRLADGTWGISAQ